MNEYAKSIAAVVGAIATILAVWGIDIAPEITAAVVTIATAVAVWWFPNADPGFDDQGRDDRIDP